MADCDRVLIAVSILLGLVLITGIVCIIVYATDTSRKVSGNGHVVKLVDGATPAVTRNKYDDQGYEMIMSDEFQDPNWSKRIWSLDNYPTGIGGITHQDPGLDWTYESKNVSFLPKQETGLMRLTISRAKPGDVASSARVSTREHARFQYGIYEFTCRTPNTKTGVWPAGWLNHCYGRRMPDGTFLYQKDFPLVCDQYWPFEIDILEQMQNIAGFNKQSVHSPAQASMGARFTDLGYCPTTSGTPGQKYGYCFGTGHTIKYDEEPSKDFHSYRMNWGPQSIEFYQDGKFAARYTSDIMNLYRNGQLRPAKIPQCTMYGIFNIALMGNIPDDFPVQHFDIQSVRLWQPKQYYAEKGLNPSWTFASKANTLKNRIFTPWVDTMCLVDHDSYVKLSEAERASRLKATCDRLKDLGDPYCDNYGYWTALNDAGLWGVGGEAFINTPNAYLSTMYGECCASGECKRTPASRVPKDLRESEFFKVPNRPPEGVGQGVAGTNPVGWKTRGMGNIPNCDVFRPMRPDDLSGVLSGNLTKLLPENANINTELSTISCSPDGGGCSGTIAFDGITAKYICHNSCSGDGCTEWSCMLVPSPCTGVLQSDSLPPLRP